MNLAYNGFPFDDSLIKNLDSLKARIDLKKASMIVLDGGVGEGKTTFMCHIAEYYQPGWMDNRSEELLAMGGTEFVKALDVAVKKGDKVIVYDEAGDFSSRGALTYFNQTLNRVFETYRQTGIIVIMGLPFFKDIDKSLFQKSIPRMLINVYDRKKNYGNYRVYSLWRTWYLRNWLSKLTVPQECYNKVDPNQRGHFKDLPPSQSEKLAKLSMKGKRRIIQEAYLRQKGLVDVEYFMQKTGLKRDSVYKKLRDLNAQSEKVGQKKYFNKDVLDSFYN